MLTPPPQASPDLALPPARTPGAPIRNVKFITAPATVFELLPRIAQARRRAVWVIAMIAGGLQLTLLIAAQDALISVLLLRRHDECVWRAKRQMLCRAVETIGARAFYLPFCVACGSPPRPQPMLSPASRVIVGFQRDGRNASARARAMP